MPPVVRAASQFSEWLSEALEEVEDRPIEQKFGERAGEADVGVHFEIAHACAHHPKLPQVEATAVTRLMKTCANGAFAPEIMRRRTESIVARRATVSEKTSSPPMDCNKLSQSVAS
jgi:hypothetical protein